MRVSLIMGANIIMRRDCNHVVVEQDVRLHNTIHLHLQSIRGINQIHYGG